MWTKVQTTSQILKYLKVLKTNQPWYAADADTVANQLSRGHYRFWLYEAESIKVSIGWKYQSDHVLLFAMGGTGTSWNHILKILAAKTNYEMTDYTGFYCYINPCCQDNSIHKLIHNHFNVSEQQVGNGTIKSFCEFI